MNANRFMGIRVMEGRPGVVRRWSNNIITLQEASIKFAQYRRASSVINRGTGIFCWFGQVGAGGVSVRYVGTNTPAGSTGLTMSDRGRFARTHEHIIRREREST